MKAKTLMCRDAAACHPDDTMADAARIMWEKDCGVVPVVDDGRRVVGIVTDRDICMAALTQGRMLAGMRVRDAMQAPVHCCTESDTRPQIHALMREYQVRRLPVVDRDGRLLGVVSLNDLAMDAVATRDHEPRSMHEVAETLAAVSRHRTPVGV
jgi:CBS domain-containing protein